MMKIRLFTAILVFGSSVAFSGCAATQTETMAAPKPSAMTHAASYARPGFYTEMHDGRLWVFVEGSKELEEFRQNGELAKQVIRPGAGPGGITLKAPDAETITLYMASKPGFHVLMEDGRLWIFKEGAKEFDEFKKQGELAKHLIRPGAGPGGITLKAPDAETLDAYLAAD